MIWFARALMIGVVGAIASPAAMAGPPELPKGWSGLEKGAAVRAYEPDGPMLATYTVKDDKGARVVWFDGWTYVARNKHGHHEFRHPKDGAVMIWIPGGTFIRGGRKGEGFVDERPQKKIHLDGFYIGKHEISWAQYLTFCKATKRTEPARPKWMAEAKIGDDHPVVNVSWDDAVAYCKWVGRALPSEAQWEKAARGPDADKIPRKYPWGAEDPTGKRCNMADKQHVIWGKNAKHDDGFAYTAPVTAYPEGASPYGALNMAGNVWEWCNDYYSTRYYAEQGVTKNPPGPKEGELRVDRGGSWDIEPFHLRVTYRGRRRQSVTNHSLGFRSAR